MKTLNIKNMKTKITKKEIRSTARKVKSLITNNGYIVQVFLDKESLSDLKVELTTGVVLQGYYSLIDFKLMDHDEKYTINNISEDIENSIQELEN